jgi:2-succinyl-5-enolpyruvyl-6-hydroxy-3-cyclohexene-1-carboxylate synthase
MITDAPNINALWSALAVEELVRQGVKYFCISPGSRSAPLTLAVANHKKAKSLVCLDERGAAFHALGYARATGKPAALVCTSGTAVANYHPAIIEAAVDCLPMLILSADRPPELRETGANQAIRQPHIFGDSVRWFMDMPCPETNIPAEMVLTTIDQAVYRAKNSPAGPVHLNFMFREPLAPTPSGEDFQPYFSSIKKWRKQSAPYTSYFSPEKFLPDAALAEIAGKASSNRGLLVIGKLQTAQEREAARKLARKLSWVTFADITSGLRSGMQAYHFVGTYDFLLRSDKIAAKLKPDFILQIGSRLTSKILQARLRAWQAKSCVLIENHPFRHDPYHRLTLRLEADIASACEQLTKALSGKSAQKTNEVFIQQHATAQTWLDDFFTQEMQLSEPAVARLVSRHALQKSGLFLASSMPVRDMDTFAAGDGHEIPVAANRGASGIDGTIASAAGFSVGLHQPVTLLIGDLAFLHDLSSLFQLRSLEHPVVIVVPNNNGGGIFSFLPVADYKKHFERFFGTPHHLTFKSAARLFGLAYENPKTKKEFIDVYQKAFRRKKSTIIEVSTDREQNRALHARLERMIVRKLECENEFLHRS